MRNFICTICGNKEGLEVFSIKNYPAYIVPLPVDIAPEVVKGDLPLFICNHCGHMQVPEPDAQLQQMIYEVYYNYYVVDNSEALVPHYRVPFTNFINKLLSEQKLPKGNLLEIGCSTGEKVDFFASFSNKYTGVDPSNRIKIAQEKYPDHTFIQGYFPQALPNNTFDVIVTQFNLEHIQNVNAFLENIFNASNENGVLLIQVPDCGYFLKTHQPNFLAHEHIQYFTKNTLSYLLERNGFRPIDWGQEGASLITAAVKTEKRVIVNQQQAAENIENAFKQAVLFKSFPPLPDQAVIFYGVGPQLYWLLSNYTGDINSIAVVDDNPSYTQQGLPGYSAVITQISKELIREKPVVILSLNKMYHKRVIEKLKNMQTTCSIIFLENDTWTTRTI